LEKNEKSTEAHKVYKKSRQNANRVISLAKGKKHRECAGNLNDPNYRLAKQMVNKRKTGYNKSNCLKGVLG